MQVHNVVKGYVGVTLRGIRGSHKPKIVAKHTNIGIQPYFENKDRCHRKPQWQHKNITVYQKQESIPIACPPPACQSYVLYNEHIMNEHINMSWMYCYTAVQCLGMEVSLW